MLKNFEAAVALRVASLQHVNRHSAIRMMPAMALGVERDFWTYRELVERVS